jgi:hypothetical protein
MAVLPRPAGSGRRSDFSAAQLLRVTLLLLLTPVRSFNLLCELLSEQRAWRRFARLSNRTRVPTPRQLHEFRSRLTPSVLRALNAHLLRTLFAHWPKQTPGVALIDCTDLRAATNEYKKSQARTSPRDKRLWGHAPSNQASHAGSSAIKNTRCGCGGARTAAPSCWCPWLPGRCQPTVAKRCFCGRVCGSVSASCSGCLSGSSAIWPILICAPSERSAKNSMSPWSRVCVRICTSFRPLPVAECPVAIKANRFVGCITMPKTNSNGSAWHQGKRFVRGAGNSGLARGSLCLLPPTTRFYWAKCRSIPGWPTTSPNECARGLSRPKLTKNNNSA